MLLVVFNSFYPLYTLSVQHKTVENRITAELIEGLKDVKSAIESVPLGSGGYRGNDTLNVDLHQYSFALQSNL